MSSVQAAGNATKGGCRLEKRFRIDGKDSPKPRSKSVPFTDEEAARKVLTAVAGRNLISKYDHQRFDGQWGELAAQAEQAGEAGVSAELENIRAGDPEAYRRYKATLDDLRLAMNQEGPPTNLDRVEIEVNNDWGRMRDEAVRALANHPDLYNRGGQIVKVGREDGEIDKATKKTVFQNVKGIPKIIPVSESNIGCALTDTANFFVWRKDKHGEDISKPTAPTSQLIKSVATLGIWPGLPILEAIAECPFPRKDGSIVDRPGYDIETRTFYSPSIEFLAVPEAPTHADAIAAWDRLAHFVCDYPFASDDDRVVYLAGLLTIIARPAVAGPVPGICVTANKPGTGKGLLIDAMVMPGTGRKCPTSTYPDADDEAKKVKVSVAKAGKLAVHLDNLTNGSSFGGSGIDSILTTEDTDERQLHSNDAPVLKLRAAWFVSGNNISPIDDAHRRWLICRIETELEFPEKRTDFVFPDLRKQIAERRAEIVRDALIILRAHSLADYPKPNWGGFGSFEDWDRVVRQAVWFASGRDCLASQNRTTEDAPERASNIALLEGIRELPAGREGQRGVIAADMIAKAVGFPDQYPTLHHAIHEMGRGGKPPSSAQVGTILRTLLKSPIGGLRLLQHPTKIHKVVAWMVQVLPDEQGGRGGVGVCLSELPREKFNSLADAITYAVTHKVVLSQNKIDPHTPPPPHDAIDLDSESSLADPVF